MSLYSLKFKYWIWNMKAIISLLLFTRKEDFCGRWLYCHLSWLIKNYLEIGIGLSKRYYIYLFFNLIKWLVTLQAASMPLETSWKTQNTTFFNLLLYLNSLSINLDNVPSHYFIPSAVNLSCTNPRCQRPSCGWLKSILL